MTCLSSWPYNAFLYPCNFIMSRKDGYLCDFPHCGKTYVKACKLEEHKRSHTNERPFVCSICSKNFLRKGHLRRHEIIHQDNPKQLKCSFDGCNKVFSLKHQLKRHEKLHSEPYVCGSCGETFTRKLKLKGHLKLVHGKMEIDKEKVGEGEKKYLCGFEGCSEKFSKWSEAVAHRRNFHSSHSEESAKFTCEICNKIFTRRNSLRTHMALHTGDQSPKRYIHSCSLCEGKLFSSRGALRVHLYTVHEGRRPYKCDECDKSFGHKHLLARHRRTHQRDCKESKDESIPEIKVTVTDPISPLNEFLGDKSSFVCPHDACGKSYKRRYDYDRHVILVHSQTNL